MEPKRTRREDRGDGGPFAHLRMAFRGLPLIVALGPAPALSLDPEPPAAEDRDEAVSGTIAELGGLFAAIRRNLEEQEKAWPARREDSTSEPVPPLAVKILQDRLAELIGRRDALLWRLEKEIAGDSWFDRASRHPLRGFDSLLEAVEDADDPEFLDAAVSLAVKLGREDARTARALIEEARRRTPCPRSIVEGLAALDNPEADLFLLELGIREKDPAMLQAAARSGRAGVFEKLIDLAGGEDREVSAAALEAIARTEPPGNGNTRALQSLVASRLLEIRSVELKTALIIYLGLFRNESHFPLLSGIYATSAVKRIRLASIAALGNIGGPAAEFLLEELEEPENPLVLRRACINALGAAGDLDAASLLIDLLAEPPLRRDAARALRRIAGVDLGESHGAWQRWWKLHHASEEEAGSEDEGWEEPGEAPGEEPGEEAGEDEEMSSGG